VKRVVALAVGLGLLLTGCSSSGGAHSYRVEFTRAIQVFPAVKVRVLGVAVGQVEDVQNAQNGVIVTFNVTKPDIKLPSNVKAAVVPQSLLGERYIQLFPAYRGGSELKPGGTIPLSRTAVPAEPDELLQSLNDYMSGLDPQTMTRFVENAAQVLNRNGANLNRLIQHGAGVIGTLSSKRNDLKTLIVQLDKLTTALATRQRGISGLIHNYNTVGHAIVDDRTALEGTISGLNQASLQLASLLVAHRLPLHEDIQHLTRTGATLTRNVNALAQSGHWATRLFRAASRAVDFNNNWLRLNNQGQELGALILLRLEQRLMELCQGAGSPKCSTPQYWSAHVPNLFCFKAVCPKASGPPAVALTSAVAQNPGVKAAVATRARHQDVTVRLLFRRLLRLTVGDPYRWTAR
jgi:phospholipid/cholesterol/gamma-HCH transport system substrate-binding protein